MNRIVPLLLVLASLMQLLCRNTSVGPQEVDYHNKILYTSKKAGMQQLYMMNSDGSSVLQITSGQFAHWNGRWSSDARKIACNTSEGWTTGGHPIVVFNTDGTGRKVIALGNALSWSPDGRRIAYSYMPHAELGVNESYIYVVNSDGTNNQQLTNGNVADSDPCWASDGSSLYFMSDRHNPGGTSRDIYVMRPDGTEIRRLTITPNGSTAIRDISADGKMMLVISSRSGQFPYAIYTMSVDTSMTSLVIQPPPSEVYNYARWAPGEKAIVIWGAMLDGSLNNHLYTYVLGSSGVISDSPQDLTVGYPDWSK